MNISIVGKNIKRIREDKGLSAYKLAKLAQVGNTTISEIENGKRQTIKSDTLDRIASALNVTSDYLLKIEDNAEYIVEDIEDAFDFLLESEELVLKDIELSKAEKDLLRITIKDKLDEIIMMRNTFAALNIDASSAHNYDDLLRLRNKALHGNNINLCVIKKEK